VSKEKTKEADEQEKPKLTKEQFFTLLDNLTILELMEYIKEYEERIKKQ